MLAFLMMLGSISAHTPDKNLIKEMKWRNLGPGNCAGRVVDVEALDNDFRYVLVASASGGVWKSTNAGTTWEPIFDHYASASIGDVALFQKDPNLIWVGTGEANNRNSVSWGDGLYKSTDGGATFQNVGLKDTYQIARIVTHPTDKDTVYVAAIGNLWGFTGDRGLFKTIDGGKTWTKLTGGLPSDGKTGATDLVMDPKDPNTLYVAFYERLRRPYRFDSGGPNGGIFKTTNAGKAWTKLSEGLPTGETGRIGLDIYRKNPRIIMAILEHSFQPRESDADYSNMSKLGSGIYRSEDGGKTWKFLNRYNNRPFYYSQIRINPQDDQKVYVLTTTARVSEDGGKTFRAAGPSFEGGLDNHAMWIDPTNKDRYYIGKDKGLTLTEDGGRSFVLYDNMPIGQFYAVGVDMRDPYFIYGGTQDNGSWGGPSFSRDVRGIQNDSWWKMHWGDVMFAQIDPTNWRNVYTEAENGSLRRYDAETHRVESIRPTPSNIMNYRDYAPERAEPATRTGLPEKFRFNWRSPVLLSPHNPHTLYLGGNHLFKTVDGGKHWLIISGDLTTNDPVKTDTSKMGGLTRDATGAEAYCSITTISESPLTPGVIWVGTDDGNVQISPNGGVLWTNVRQNIPEVPADIWVSSIEASHFDEGTAYLTFDGHRSDNFTTWVFKTADYGKTWTNITHNLSERQPMLVVREGLKNKNLLFAGSEFALFVSLNGGTNWTPLMNNLPTVAFYDLVIHPRDGDLVAGTHGRGIWILDDITPLEQLSAKVLDSPAYLFENRPATIWEDASRGGARGQFFFAAKNPPYIPKPGDVVRGTLSSGASINYYLKTKPASEVLFEVSDVTGKNKRTLTGSPEPGINRLFWDLRFDPSPRHMQQYLTRIQRLLERSPQFAALSAQQKEELNKSLSELKSAPSGQEFNQGLAARRGLAKLKDRFKEFAESPLFEGAQGDEVSPGEYQIKMTVDGTAYLGKIKVRRDPMLEGRDPSHDLPSRTITRGGDVGER